MYIFFKKHKSQIYISLFSSIIFGVLVFLFSKPLISFLNILIFIWFQNILPNFFSIIIIIISVVIGVLIYLEKFKFKKTLTSILLSLCLSFFFFGLYLLFHDSPCSIKDIRTYSYFSPIVLDENGDYTSSNVAAREIGQGIKKVLSEKINANNISPTLDEKMAVKFLDFPKYLINFNLVKKMDSEHLSWKFKNCSGVVNWLEFNNDGYVTNIQVSNNFPFLIGNTNLDAIFNIKDRINRLISIGVLKSNESKGIYMGRIYKTFIELSNSNYYADEDRQEDSLAVVNFSRLEIDKLTSYLIIQKDEITDPLRKNKALDYIIEDKHIFTSEFEYLNFYTYAYKGFFPEAEEHLKNAFIEIFKVQKSNSDIFTSFQNEYFSSVVTNNVSYEDFLIQIKRNGYTDTITPMSQYINLYFETINYFKYNPSFDYNAFFVWLDENDSRNPVTYMFWGKILTLDGKFKEAAQKYHTAYTLYPKAPILGLFEQIAYLNFYNSENVTQENKKHIESEIKKHIDLSTVFLEELKKMGYETNNHQSCEEKKIGNWIRWCAN